MSEMILSKGRRKLVLIPVILCLLAATMAFVSYAEAELIKADEGGIVSIDRGVFLSVPPGALEEDTVITGTKVEESDRICFYFEPSGTVFLKAAKLNVSWRVVSDVESYILYGEDGEEIQPETFSWGLRHDIWHFSLYYYRRR